MINDGWSKTSSLGVSVSLLSGTDEIILDPIVRSVTWSGDVKQASRKLDVELSNTSDGIESEVQIDKGSEIVFKSNGSVLFRGVVFADQIDVRGQMRVTAYDENIYLTKNKDTKKFTNKTATAIILALCEEYDIPFGEVVDTGFIIPKLILRDKTLFDMIVTALTVTYFQTGRRYFLFSRNGKLALSERKNVVADWILERGTNILESSYQTSIEETKTRVRVMSEHHATSTTDTKGKTTKQKSPIDISVQNDDLVKKFGIMQHLETTSSDKTLSESKQLAEQLLTKLSKVVDEARITSIGIDNVYAGVAVYAREPMTGLAGSYYVSADSHKFERGVHTMQLTITATDDLPILVYEAPYDSEAVAAAKPAPKAKKGRKPRVKKPKVKKGRAPTIVDLIMNAKGVGTKQ